MSETQSFYRYLAFTNNAPYRRYIQVKHPHAQEDGLGVQASVSVNAAHGSYGAFLLHPKWKLRRRDILTRDMHRCVHCKSDKTLQVHHRQYHFILTQQQFRLPWEYPDHLLITLCESCHARGHNKYKVPTINI